MVNHNGFIFLRNKETRKIGMFYIGSGCLHENFSEEELVDYERIPIPFERVDYDTLVELFGNIYEDRNWHKALYRLDTLLKVIKSNTDDVTASNILRQFILEIEKE